MLVATATKWGYLFHVRRANVVDGSHSQDGCCVPARPHLIEITTPDNWSLKAHIQYVLCVFSAPAEHRMCPLWSSSATDTPTASPAADLSPVCRPSVTAYELFSSRLLLLIWMRCVWNIEVLILRKNWECHLFLNIYELNFSFIRAKMHRSDRVLEALSDEVMTLIMF